MVTSATAFRVPLALCSALFAHFWSVIGKNETMWRSNRFPTFSKRLTNIEVLHCSSHDTALHVRTRRRTALQYLE